MKPLHTVSLAVIVVGYKSRNDLPACLQSLKGSTYKDFITLFIDNSGDDGSLEYVQAEFPEVECIPNTENLGFAKANNLAAKRAKELGAQYVFLLNPDASVEKTCIAELMKNASSKDIIQPVILLESDPKKINTAGNILHYLGFSYCGHYKETYVRSDERLPVSIISGAAVLIPMEVISKIGLFDEHFFMYHEDADFSWRAQIAGYNLSCLYSVTALHRYEFSRNMKKMFYTERNRWLLMLKNYQFWTLIVVLPVQLVNELSVLVFALIGGWFPEKLRSYGAILTALPRTIRQRGEVRKMRHRSDRSLAPLLAARLDFSEITIPLLGLYNGCVALYWRAARLIL